MLFEPHDIHQSTGNRFLIQNIIFSLMTSNGEGPDESNLFGGGLVPWIGIGDHILLQAREGATCKNLEF